jgi:hypothetical protein
MSRTHVIELVCAICLLLAVFALPVAAQAANKSDRFFECSARNFAASRSESVVDAQYQLDLRRAGYQAVADGTLSSEVSRYSGSNSQTTSASLKVSKTLWSFALESYLNANESDLRANQRNLRSETLDFLLGLNDSVLQLSELLVNQEVLGQQLSELKDLDSFASSLMKSRVIDPADALLVHENVLRFNLERMETSRQMADLRKQIEARSGIAGPSQEFLRAESVTSVWNQVVTRLSRIPKVEAASLKSLALKAERTAVDRAWYPELVGEVGVVQPDAASEFAGGSAGAYAGLSLRFTFQNRTISANGERVRALAKIQDEKSRLAEIEYRALVQSSIENLNQFRSQLTAINERKENLERLHRLQLVKFRSGRISFLNLNDVMLSVLDVRRQARTVALKIAKIERDGRLILQAIESGDSQNVVCE